MRFRKLTPDELEPLEKEFIQFLVSNGIEGKDWEKIQKEGSKGDDIMDQFSDIVFEKTLEKVEYLEHRTSTDLKVFYCSESGMELIALKSSSVDLTDPNIDLQNLDNIEIFIGKKGYSGNREDELFKMTQHGCLITDHKLFRLLSQFVKKNG